MMTVWPGEALCVCVVTLSQHLFSPILSNNKKHGMKKAIVEGVCGVLSSSLWKRNSEVCDMCPFSVNNLSCL